ncbi:MAG: hypothetical protein EAX96_07660 [Candidatus Lokiarchaeota archaeon]|nr:hypothetical protein [Candidatus Lokiarchaeota archaeon]
MIGELKTVGFVYKDIFSILKKLEDFFDLSKLKIEEVTFNKNILNEDIEPVKLKIASAFFTTITLEFISIIEGKNIFEDFLSKSEGGLHHVGFNVNNLNESIEKLKSQGLKMIFNGSNTNIKMVIFDTQMIFGHDTKIIEEL